MGKGGISSDDVWDVDVTQLTITERVSRVFEIMDTDNNGEVDCEELMAIAGPPGKVLLDDMHEHNYGQNGKISGT